MAVAFQSVFLLKTHLDSQVSSFTCSDTTRKYYPPDRPLLIVTIFKEMGGALTWRSRSYGFVIASLIACTLVYVLVQTGRSPEELLDVPNLLGALGDNIRPGLFPEYRLPGKVNPAKMPGVVRMISRRKLVDMIRGIETDRAKMKRLNDKVLELKAQALAVQMQAKNLMNDLKSNIAGVLDENAQVQSPPSSALRYGCYARVEKTKSCVLREGLEPEGGRRAEVGGPGRGAWHMEGKLGRGGSLWCCERER